MTKAGNYTCFYTQNKKILSTKTIYDNDIDKEIMLFIKGGNNRIFIPESLFLC